MTPKYSPGDVVYIPQQVTIYSVHIGKFGISYGIRNRETKQIQHVKENRVWPTEEEAKIGFNALWLGGLSDAKPQSGQTLRLR